MRLGRKRQNSQPTRLIGVDLSGLGDDPLSEIRLFQDARTTEDLDRVLQREVETEVHEILAATAECDAFDVIELLRLREFPIAPVAGLAPGFDGSGAAIELVSLVLRTRASRKPGGTPREETRPHEIIPELHRRAKRLLRLASFRTQFDVRVKGGDAITRLASTYQSYFVGVRAQQYESVQMAHDRALFDRAEVDRLLERHLGFTYAEFVSVRDAIQDSHSSELSRLRDQIAAFAAARGAGSEPMLDEMEAFGSAMQSLLFLPGERAGFGMLEIAERASLDIARVESVLMRFSIGFDGTRNAVDDIVGFLRGRNPLSSTCLIRSDADFIMTSSQIGADSFRSVVESALKPVPKAWHRYDRTRTSISEELAVRALEQLLQTPATFTNLKYLAPKTGEGPEALAGTCPQPTGVGVQVESDALFVVDDLAVCVEVKGRTLAEAARRGDLARLKTEVEDTMGSGASQARRLEALIRTNGGIWREDRTWLDLSGVREVRTIVVGLDFFGPLAVALGDLEAASLLGEGRLPWIASLHDLDVIGRVIARPAEFLLYLRRRADSGVATYYRGLDELDLFMLFMDGGLYVERDPDEVRREHPRTPAPSKGDRARHRASARPTVVGTHTDPLDEWMYWTEGSSPFEVEKPVFNCHVAAQKIVDFLAAGKKPGWLRFGSDLLGLSGEAQARLGSDVERLIGLTTRDSQYHTMMYGYAGHWGFPTLFVATTPNGLPGIAASDRLRTYMIAKKHQVQSDRSLGLLYDDRGGIVSVLYMNDPPADNPVLDEVGEVIGLQPTWTRRAGRSANRMGSASRNGSKKRRRR